jgi:uncharacterized membrane protein HdeD (DUF308 family)
MGIVSIGLGVLALAYPHITLLALILLVALRAIAVGIFELVAAFSSWDVSESRWLLGLTGVLSVVFGVLILGSPAVGGLALIWTIGVYAIIIGVGLFVQGVKAVRLEHRDRGETRFPGPAVPAT